jgi:hypothetical protein
MKKSDINSWYVKIDAVYWTPGPFTPYKWQATFFQLRDEAEAIAEIYGGKVYPSTEEPG